VGGTSVLYLSPVPFEQMGFDVKLGTEPMPDLTANAMEKIPNVVTVGGVMLGGIWWITKRREEVEKHEGSHKPTPKNQDQK